MACSFSWVNHGTAPAAGASGTFNRDVSLSGLTIGRGLIVHVMCGATGTYADINACSLTVGSGSPAFIAAQQSGNDMKGRIAYLPSLAETSVTFRASFVNGANTETINFNVYQVDGHNTADMIGGSGFNANNPTTPSLSVTSGNGVLVFFQGGSSEPGTCSGSIGGSYSVDDTENASARAWAAYKNTLSSGGTESLTVTNSWWGYAVEIKAAAVVGGIPKTNRFALMGVG